MRLYSINKSIKERRSTGDLEMVEANTKVQKEKEETAENEIRVAVVGKVSSYLGYAFRILNKSEHRSLTIRATGNAIVKALILIELVKRRIGELH